jgi:hypothetical protein
MLKPTIDKQIYSWGTSKRPAASYSSEAPSGPTNLEYVDLQISHIEVPNPNNLGTRPVDLSKSKYGWVSGVGATTESLPLPTNLEYGELKQSDTVVPSPIIIPNFAEKQFETDEPGSMTQQDPGVSVSAMGDIILQYKKEIGSPDYRDWVVAITAYKKIIIARMTRVLTPEEKQMLSDIESRIELEMKNISLTIPAAAAPVVAPVVAGPAVAGPAGPGAAAAVAPVVAPVMAGPAGPGAAAAAQPGASHLQRFGAYASGVASAIMGVSRPAAAQPVLAQPGAAQLAVAQPVVAQPGAAQLAVAQPIQPIVALPPVGVSGIDPASLTPPVMIGMDHNQGFNIIVNDPSQDPNNPWLTPMPGVGDPIVQLPNNPWLTPMPGVGDPILQLPVPGVGDADEEEKEHVSDDKKLELQLLNKWWAGAKGDKNNKHYKSDPRYRSQQQLRKLTDLLKITGPSDPKNVSRLRLLDKLDAWTKADNGVKNKYQQVLEADNLAY